MNFEIKSNFKPTGDQPEAINALLNSLNNNDKFVTLEGVTGSGKTFTIANTIEKFKKPALFMRVFLCVLFFNRIAILKLSLTIPSWQPPVRLL